MHDEGVPGQNEQIFSKPGIELYSKSRDQPVWKAGWFVVDQSAGLISRNDKSPAHLSRLSFPSIDNMPICRRREYYMALGIQSSFYCYFALTPQPSNLPLDSSFYLKPLFVLEIN
jgi:hypothetical protein